MQMQMGEELFEISIDFSSTQYTPGETIFGEVYLNLSVPVKTECVAILFQGLEKSFNGIPTDTYVKFGENSMKIRRKFGDLTNFVIVLE
jgi:hypothetical protein